MKPPPIDQDGCGRMERLAQRLASLDGHRIGLVHMFLQHLGMDEGRGQRQNARYGLGYSASPHGSISVSVESAANSGAKASMICCGSGHSLVSVMTPNWTPPP